ncbi:MAG: hypothetical protein Tsb002_01670 [Wenzhouxiangellaceae bacterium]
MRALPLMLLLTLVSAYQSADARRPKPASAADFQDLSSAWDEHREMSSTSPFHGLEWRNIGPVVQGGRVVDVATVPGQPYTFYVAYASGGVWKTTNNGVTFEPLFDDMPTMIIGDIAVDPNNPETVWVGTGEPQSSRSSYGGMGVYRSTDGGQSWTHMGLGDTNRISKVLVDPRDSQRIFVAALGKLYSKGGDRGLFLSEDGGANWRQVLAGDDWTGVIDLLFHPSDPDTLYAATWERSRQAWDFVEGGEGSGVWRSRDGGRNWTRLQGGLPSGDKVGRIGLAVSAAAPDVLYAVVDNQADLDPDLTDLGDRPLSAKRLQNMSKETFLGQSKDEIEAFIRSNDFHPEVTADSLIEQIENDELSIQDLIDALGEANRSLFNTDIIGLELYRSDNQGDDWQRTHKQPIREVVYSYGYYFGQVRAAPDDENRLYLLGVPLITSNDGGKTFSGMNDPDVHVDHHSFWIDPEQPQRMMLGNDGGLDITYDGGQSWLKLDAQPVGQFYTIHVDMAEPYNVYGGLQDNGTYKGSSKTRWQDGPSWQFINGGDGMYVAVDPRDNSTTYTGYQFGNYVRLDDQGRTTVRPRNRLQEEPLRYNWNTPVVLSPHNYDIVYFGANKLFRSMDQGETWTAISDDLTRSPERGDVPFATITTIAESAKQFGLIWVGTDDGQVWVTDSGGSRWYDAAESLPRDRWVSRVEASSHQRDRAYVSLNGYRNDDHRAYLYRSDDLGRNWRDISKGLPDEAINVVREDPVNGDIIYVGTDRSVYVSLNGGDDWQTLDSQLPKVPVHDLVIHPRDRELVAGTHGRSVWIVDVLPLQELTSEVREQPLKLFYVDEVKAQRGWRSRRSPWFYDPQDEEPVLMHYWSRDGGEGELAIINDDDQTVQRLSVAARPGINRLTWDRLLDESLAIAAEKAANEDLEDIQPKDQPLQQSLELGHPLYVLPGDYTLRLTIAGEESEQSLTIKAPTDFKPRGKPEPPLRGKK